MNSFSFPKDFLWGVATSSFQIEGGFEGGRGETNWDRYAHIPGVIYQNHNADQGADHLNHWEEDVALLSKLGVNSYRFSFSWARLFPDGLGEPNEEGFRFYDRLLDELEARHIEPLATIFHWDYPQALVEKGGWTNPESPLWFKKYAEAVIARYGKRIRKWVTINEMPNAVLMGGIPLRMQLTTAELLSVVHRILLAHGYAARVLHQAGCLVGTALCGLCFVPNSDSEEDVLAAEKANFSLRHAEIYDHALWTDPMVLGKYPEEYFDLYPEDERPNIGEEDLALIGEGVDFIGLNLYQAILVEADGKGGYRELNHPVGNAKTTMDWDVCPRIMRYLPKYFFKRYNLPIAILENGCSVTDILSEEKEVHDGARIEFLKQHLKELKKAMEEGVPCFGYFVWSLLDNFEWFQGYSKRFGLVYIDYKSKERFPKDSFAYYQGVIKTNGEKL